MPQKVIQAKSRENAQCEINLEEMPGRYTKEIVNRQMKQEPINRSHSSERQKKSHCSCTTPESGLETNCATHGETADRKGQRQQTYVGIDFSGKNCRSRPVHWYVAIDSAKEVRDQEGQQLPWRKAVGSEHFVGDAFPS